VEIFLSASPTYLGSNAQKETEDSGKANPKTRSASKRLRTLWTAVPVAQEMGKMLAGGALLFRCLSA